MNLWTWKLKMSTEMSTKYFDRKKKKSDFKSGTWQKGNQSVDMSLTDL